MGILISPFLCGVIMEGNFTLKSLKRQGVDVDSYIQKGITIPKQIYFHFVTGLPEQPKCSCGKNRKWSESLSRYREHCSYECSSKHNQPRIQESIIYNNGIHPFYRSNIQDLAKQGVMNKHGVENVLQIDEVKETRKEEVRKKFGGAVPSASKEVQKKSQNTMMKNHGVAHYRQNKEINKKMMDDYFKRTGKKAGFDDKESRIKKLMSSSSFNKYGTHFENVEDFKSLSETISEKYKDFNPSVNDNYSDLMKSFDNNLYLLNYFYKCNNVIPKNDSEIITKYKNELDKMGIEYIENSNIVDEYIIDIHIPKFNISIDIIAFDNNSIISKRELIATKKNISLFQIFYVDADRTFDIVINKIKYLNSPKSYWVEDCHVAKVPQKDHVDFLENYNIYGTMPVKYKYGLYKGRELIYCVSFNIDKENRMVVHRITHKDNIKVFGAFEEIVDHVSTLVKINGFVFKMYNTITDYHLVNSLGYDLKDSERARVYIFEKNGKFISQATSIINNKIVSELNNKNILISPIHNLVFEG